MFKRLVELIIKITGKIHNSLENTYKETYSDKSISKLVSKEIEKRKKENKQEFIDNIILAIGVSSMMRCQKPPTLNEAKKRAEQIFLEAKERGNLDEFNKLKEQEEWS